RFQPADDFPSDDVGYGFDNIGDVLSLPPMLMEKYLAAAEAVVDVVFKAPEARQRIVFCQPTDATPTALPVLAVTPVGLIASPLGQGPLLAPSTLILGRAANTECARKIVERFATRAFRRPVSEEEVSRLVRLVQLAEREGDGFETGIRLAVQAVL